MRTAKSWAGAAALAVGLTFLTASPIQATVPDAAIASAIGEVSSGKTKSKSARTQLVVAGMVAAFAALMVLRRNSAENN